MFYAEVFRNYVNVSHQTYNLFIYLYHHGLIESYLFIVLIHYYQYLFWCSNFPTFGQWELLSSCFLCSFDMSPSFLSISLLVEQCSRLILYFPTPPWNQSFLQGALVPFSEEAYVETKVWVLGILITIGISLLPDCTSTEWGIYVCMYVHITMYTHIYIYIDFYICILVCWKPGVHAIVTNPSPTPQVCSSFLPSHTCKCFSVGVKPCSPCLLRNHLHGQAPPCM